jgi:flagellar hook-associated protein 1 FlgK
MLRNTLSDSERYTTEDEMLERVEAIFSLYQEDSTIGDALTEFFTAVNDLRTDPGNIELRSNLLERANDLTSRINQSFGTLASLQDEIDQRIDTEIASVNAITAQIAELNGWISQQEAAGQTSSDYRDQRDVLMQNLAERMSYNVVEDSSGAVTISLPSGFALVYGTHARSLETSETPSFLPGAVAPSLSGGVLDYIVYDYSNGAGTAHFDLTSEIGNGGGTLAGLLQIRGIQSSTDTTAFEASGVLVELAARIEGITRQLLTSFNEVYRGPDIAAGNLAGDLDGNSPAVFGLFSFAGAVDTDADGVPSAIDLAALGLDNYSSLISVAITDPREIAAAFDANPPAGDYPAGDGQNLAAIAALQSDDTLDFSVGVSTFVGTFEEAYNEAVAYLGNTKARAAVNKKVSADALTAAENRRDQLSAVSLDEEFASLIKYQQAYNASAKMIATARDLYDQLLGLL